MGSSNDIEDEFHFNLVCQRYKNKRDRFIVRYYYKNLVFIIPNNSITLLISFTVHKKVNRNVQEEPQAEAAANPHEEEEK